MRKKPALMSAGLAVLSIAAGLFGYAYPPEAHSLLRTLMIWGFWVSLVIALLLLAYASWGRRDRIGKGMRAANASKGFSELPSSTTYDIRDSGNIDIADDYSEATKFARLQRVEGFRSRRIRHEPRDRE